MVVVATGAVVVDELGLDAFVAELEHAAPTTLVAANNTANAFFVTGPLERAELPGGA